MSSVTVILCPLLRSMLNLHFQPFYNTTVTSTLTLEHYNKCDIHSVYPIINTEYIKCVIYFDYTIFLFV